MKPAAALVTVVLCLFSFGQSSDPALTPGLHLLEQGRSSLEEKTLAEAKSYFAGLTQKDPTNSVYFYELARVNGYLVDSFANRGDKKAAEHAVEDAITAVERSISLNDKSADAHSLLADLYGRKIGLGMGMMAGARFGPKSDAENKKALALDANNPRVYASLGRQYLHAPKMFGGDVDKAIASFRKASELDPDFDENYVWLAIAYRKKGDAAEADKALQEALRRNPGSAFAKWTQSGKSE
jgi:tetratricopeptide (TPR) repeat protein